MTSLRVSLYPSAVDMGTDMLELDVHLTKDDQVRRITSPTGFPPMESSPLENTPMEKFHLREIC